MTLADRAQPIARTTIRDRAANRVAATVAWSRALADELARFPGTLRSFREGATNFEVVTQRLVAASRALEDAAALYESTFAESARRSNAVFETLQSQIDSLAATASPERLPSMIDELQRSVDLLARMNPFWPGRSPRDGEVS